MVLSLAVIHCICDYCPLSLCVCVCHSKWRRQKPHSFLVPLNSWMFILKPTLKQSAIYFFVFLAKRHLSVPLGLSGSSRSIVHSRTNLQVQPRIHQQLTHPAEMWQVHLILNSRGCSTTLASKAFRKKIIPQLIYHDEVKDDFILQKALPEICLKPPNKRKPWCWTKD